MSNVNACNRATPQAFHMILVVFNDCIDNINERSTTCVFKTGLGRAFRFGLHLLHIYYEIAIKIEFFIMAKHQNKVIQQIEV